MEQSEFIDKARKVHGDKYDYSKINYVSSTEKINIICSKHGIFSQRASNHLLGCGCRKCNLKLPINPKITTCDFIEKAKTIHGDKYDYSLVEYINSHTKIKIRCNNNHIFDQTPGSHLNGNGCHVCSRTSKMNTESFIKKSKEIHNDIYDYSLVNYKNNTEKVKIICKKHGVFETRANNHISKLKRGCPNCRISKNEILITKILEKNNINFEPQKIFKDCKYKKQLYFDFYLSDFNMCIEYDGKQHYENIYNSDEFKNMQVRDNIKNEFCKVNNITLHRIKYDENVILKLNSIIKVRI